MKSWYTSRKAPNSSPFLRICRAEWDETILSSRLAPWCIKSKKLGTVCLKRVTFELKDLETLSHDFFLNAWVMMLLLISCWKVSEVLGETLEKCVTANFLVGDRIWKSRLSSAKSQLKIMYTVKFNQKSCNLKLAFGGVTVGERLWAQELISFS